MSTTLRETAKAAILEEVSQAERYSHQRNYQKLHVRRDGTVNWFESINTSDDLIDSQAKGFQAIQSVHTTGTGSYACNCAWCNEVYHPDVEALAQEQGRAYDRSAKYETYEEAINAAVCDSDLSGIEEGMLKAFEDIPAGYFDDEEEQDNL
jgi:hypothetical protein